MTKRFPKICVSILVIEDNKFLLGLLTKKWTNKGKQVYGVPGRDILFKETIGDAVRRNIKEELNCKVSNYKIICVNANHEFGNHYIGVGIVADIKGEIELLKPVDWETWEWIDKDKIPDNLLPDTENMINCYLKKKFNVSE